ncbi:ubiquitin-like-specific protease ESD4 [Cyclospora cayetanensis]|uniref:Ubiquitin-like-specific protease ESD4 n=1 Tax=Cyclospora cayetanensis TaxID=88456 RepID=A0A6P6RXW6_9EIME|nr:ubiquitin-like-specific protease ESD4 [Cyclospora cayetanensis]
MRALNAPKAPCWYTAEWHAETMLPETLCREGLRERTSSSAFAARAHEASPSQHDQSRLRQQHVPEPAELPREDRLPLQRQANSSPHPSEKESPPEQDLASYRSRLRAAGQLSLAPPEYEPAESGALEGTSEKMHLREVSGAAFLPRRTPSLLLRASPEPQSLSLLREQQEAMEVMLKAHKQHENAVLTLLTHLELAREEKALREEQLKKRLVVPPPPPPPLVPMRFGRAPKTRCTSPEEAKAARRLFRENLEGDKELIEKFNIPITVETLRCLEGSNWLNDEVINFYLNLLQERNKKQLENGENVCRCYFFSTFFYAKLSGASGSEEAAYNYEGVRRWTKRQKVDLFSKDLIFIPLHLGHLHWTLGVIDMRQGRESIRFFDSLNGKHKPLAERLRRYLRDEHEDKKGFSLDKERTWYAKANGEPEEGAPQQENGFDCGVFLCQMAECIADGRAFDFQQKDIKNIRLKMALDIVRGEIDL